MDCIEKLDADLQAHRKAAAEKKVEVEIVEVEFDEGFGKPLKPVVTSEVPKKKTTFFHGNFKTKNLVFKFRH